MLQATVRFQPDREDLTADGWVVVLSDDSSLLSTTYYATITAATAAVRTAFQGDADIDGYFSQAAEDVVLAANTSAVATAKASLLSTEGL